MNPLTFKFSPAVPETASLSDNPCFRIYTGLVNALTVLAENWLIPTTEVTIKSPKFASLAFNTLNLFPTASP